MKQNLILMENLDRLDRFMDLFPQIDFFTTTQPQKPALSIEAQLSGVKEVERMLRDARRDWNRARKLHKQNKMSSEELFDFEWRMRELEEELRKLREDGEQSIG